MTLSAKCEYLSVTQQNTVLLTLTEKDHSSICP